jgi:hypothetical protein
MRRNSSQKSSYVMSQWILIISYSLLSLDVFTLHPTTPCSGQYQPIHVINKSKQHIIICRPQMSLSPSAIPILTAAATTAVPVGLIPRSHISACTSSCNRSRWDSFLDPHLRLYQFMQQVAVDQTVTSHEVARRQRILPAPHISHVTPCITRRM